jgi:hypothetical protein
VISFTTHEEVDALFPHQLREAILEIIHVPPPRPITLGLLLWRMKKEKLFLQWGWEKISLYYTTEIHVPVSRAEVWIAVARRCLSHELTLADMQTVELLVPHYGKLGQLTRYARSKAQLMEGARRLAAGLPFPQLKLRLNAYYYKPVHATSIGERPLDYEAVHLVNDWLKKKLRRPGHSLLIPFLVVKAMHEKKPGHRYKYFRRLLLRHGVPEELLPVIFLENE